MPVVLIVVPYDGVMAAIFKDGRQKDIKLPILNVWVGVLDTSDISLTKMHTGSVPLFGTHIRFGSWTTTTLHSYLFTHLVTYLSRYVSL